MSKGAWLPLLGPQHLHGGCGGRASDGAAVGSGARLPLGAGPAQQHMLKDIWRRFSRQQSMAVPVIETHALTTRPPRRGMRSWCILPVGEVSCFRPGWHPVMIEIVPSKHQEHPCSTTERREACFQRLRLAPLSRPSQ